MVQVVADLVFYLFNKDMEAIIAHNPASSLCKY